MAWKGAWTLLQRMAVIAAVFGVFYIGYAVGSDRQQDRLDFVVEQRDDCRYKTQELLGLLEQREPSSLQPTESGGPSTKDWAASLTQGVARPVGDTGYTVEVADIRSSPEGAYTVTVAVTHNGERAEADIAMGATRIISGICVEVVSANAGRAELELTLP